MKTPPAGPASGRPRAVASLAASIVLGMVLFLGCTRSPSQPSESDRFVVFDDTLQPGFDLGVDDALKSRDWVRVSGGELRMFYPGGRSWGVAFIFAGILSDDERVSLDFSSFDTLIVELRSDSDRSIVRVGIKDRTDPDDGSESTRTLQVGSDWSEWRLPLRDLETADLSDVYIPVEFIFDGDPACNIYCRRVVYERSRNPLTERTLP